MLEALLKKYNHHRKENFFQSPLFHTRKKYAFIGVGMHSLTNFYPLLRWFNISLKYICTRHSDPSKDMAALFPGCIFTHSLNDILRDEGLGGVFVCAAPGAHYTLLTALLQAGKNIFVEKPPCSTLPELRQLIALGEGRICKVGLQRRYWPGNAQALKKCRRATGYIYQFQTGPYPQGDPFTELFIHPLDYCRFLFGDYRMDSFSVHRDDPGLTLSPRLAGQPGLTVHMHVRHDNGVSGLLQLSTHHSWNPALESLHVNCRNESLLIQYPGSVSARQAPVRFLNIPAERLLRQPAITKEYFSGGPSLIPALEMNALVTQGFYKELETFISLAENSGHAAHAPSNDLDSLLSIYGIIEQLKKG